MRYEIKNGSNKTYYFRQDLRAYGCQFKKTGKYTGYWYIDTDDCFLENKLQAFCTKKRLTFIIIESQYDRNSHYRNDFFSSYTPTTKKGKQYYRCVYCGRLLPKQEITVDHLIPVAKVRKGIFKNIYRNLLKKFDINDINDTKNLVPACSRCNKRKSAKTGMWIVQGILGKNEYYWKTIYFISIILLVIGIIYIFINY